MSVEKMVLEFHEKYGHKISTSPQNPGFVVETLRMKLIQEEVNEELLPALLKNDLLEIADGAADAIYVIVGTCISYGIPIDRIFAEVHESNMTKTPVKATDGNKYGTKTPKGPDYIAPDIEGILFNPGKETKLEFKRRIK